MASADSQLNIVLNAVDNVSKQIASVQKSLGNLSGATKEVNNSTKGMSTSIFSGVAAWDLLKTGIGFVSRQMGSFITEAQEAARNQKVLNAVLASTQGAAGMTASAINNIASSLSRETNFSDDAILSAENMLLTFTNIKQNIFPEVTEAVLNMAVAMDGGATPSAETLRGSAVRLGKALQDPVVGATALRKVGVALTATQMDQIKAFVEVGDVASAQKMILKELETEFGNLAKAASSPTQKMKVALDEVKETIGTMLLPIIGRVSLAIEEQAYKIVDWVTANKGAIQNVLDNIISFGASVISVLSRVWDAILPLLVGMRDWFIKNKEEITKLGKAIIDGLIKALNLLADILIWLIPKIVDFTKFLIANKNAIEILAIAVGVLYARFILYPPAIAAASAAVVTFTGVLAGAVTWVKALTLATSVSIFWPITVSLVGFALVWNQIQKLKGEMGAAQDSQAALDDARYSAVANAQKLIKTGDEDLIKLGRALSEQQRVDINGGDRVAARDKIQLIKKELEEKGKLIKAQETLGQVTAKTGEDSDDAMKTAQAQAKLLQAEIDKLAGGYTDLSSSASKSGSKASDALKKQQDAMVALTDKVKDYKKSIQEIQKAQEDESMSFIKSQIEKKQSFEQQLADMVADHKEKWQDASREREKLEREGIKNYDDLQRLGELTATQQREFNIIQPYLNNTEMTKLAETSDVEKLITAYRATQAEDTVATGIKQQELKEKATNLYINFDLKDTTITDMNFIQKVKDALSASLQLAINTK